MDFDNPEFRPHVDSLMHATEYALRQNVRIVRIQTSDDVANRWAVWIGNLLS